MNNYGWSDMDINILRALYPKHGAIGVRESMPHRTTAAIRAQAARMKIKSHCPPKSAGPGWGMPAMDLLQQLECVRLKNWRGPVMAGPLVATIGRAVA